MFTFFLATQWLILAIRHQISSRKCSRFRFSLQISNNTPNIQGGHPFAAFQSTGTHNRMFCQFREGGRRGGRRGGGRERGRVGFSFRTAAPLCQIKIHHMRALHIVVSCHVCNPSTSLPVVLLWCPFRRRLLLQCDMRRRHLQECVRLCRAAWWHGHVPRVFFLSARRRK